jgi:type IV pilus assembly protein PilE
MAYASYSNSVRKSRRTEARAAVLDAAGREERLFSTLNQYSSSPTQLGYSASATSFGSGLAVGSGYYLLTVTNVAAATAGTPATYTVTATATGTQTADAACASFSVDQQGNQTAANSGGGDNTIVCWTK